MARRLPATNDDGHLERRCRHYILAAIFFVVTGRFSAVVGGGEAAGSNSRHTITHGLLETQQGQLSFFRRQWTKSNVDFV